VRLVSWNVAGRVRRQAEQAEHVASAVPDLVALQEVTTSTLEAWRSALGALGLEHLLAAADLAGFPGDRRGLSVLLASRWPLQALDQPAVPWPERVLVVRVCAPAAIDVCVVHSPVSQRPGLVKVRTHEALWTYLNAKADRPWIVCGDLNTPRREHPDGTVWTFARSSRGVLRPERGERWDAAEQALLRGLGPSGFRDAFRSLHGYAEREPTWTWPRGGGYRLDHLITSAAVRVTHCVYRHEWREEGLSDHSALVADVDPGSGLNLGASGY
jgi:exonuclease III